MSNPSSSGYDIAVIGMAGRFPGARDVAEFWRNLRDGVESIKALTDEELLAAGESPVALQDPDYVRVQPVLAAFDQFDAGFFGFSPQDAAILDPQHRLFLEVGWEALENAGHTSESFAGNIGVFAASGMNAYMMHNLVNNRRIMGTVGEWLVRHTGNDMNFLATRLSYLLNLTGPSINVQTACSSALVSIHLACQSLLSGECDMALAGGSTIVLPHNRGYLYRQGEILSPDGHCRPFDANARGTLFGSGAGVVALRRLSDAEADGDTILAVIKGSAINNDGSSKVGYLAPSVDGQAKAITEALTISGIEPDTIGYVEMHGTGTIVGDPIEVTALTQAWRQFTDKRGICAIGSLKSNIGHLGEAAGIAAFIKTVLALNNREIPPSLNFESPNPQIDFADSPFFVNTGLASWPKSTAPRRAAVTALGAGGTNCHVILEEAPPAQSSSASRPWQLLTLSAATAAALDEATEGLASHLRANPGINLADVAYTLKVGRKAFLHRRSLACRDIADALRALDPLDLKRVTTRKAEKNSSVVFMFPGGGAQYASMGRDLYESEPIYRDVIDRCADYLKPSLGLDLRTLMFPTSNEAEASLRLEAPSLALPTLFATEYALAKLLMSWGVKPAAMIGHSMGEYVAASLAGVISYEQGLSLVACRGRLFESLSPGSMLVVSLPEDEVRSMLGADLSIAAINGPSLCVAAGPILAIERLRKTLTEKLVDTTPVHISVAAHSTMLDPILPEFEAFCRRIPFEAPKVPYISNLTGTWITAAEATDPAYWVRHLRHTVQFAAGVQVLLQDADHVMIEIGPGRTLSSLARQQPAKPVAALPTMRHPAEEVPDLSFLLSALGQVWQAGVAIDWARFYDGERRARLALPTYPFQRQRYWIEPDARDAIAAQSMLDASGHVAQSKTSLEKQPAIADWFAVPSWKKASPAHRSASATESDRNWLIFLDEDGLGSGMIERLRCADQPNQGAAGESLSPEIFCVRAGVKFTKTGERDFTIAPGREADYLALLQALEAAGAKIGHIAHLWNLAPALPSSASFAQQLDRGFFSLTWLGKALGNRDWSQPIDIAVISTGLQQIAGETHLEPMKAILLGPCRVLPRELSSITCRSIDIPRSEAGSWQRERILQQLAEELASGSEERTIAYRGMDRWVQRYEPALLDEGAAKPALRRGGVYLITGGLGGLGLELAEHLARSVKAKLILVGRTPLPARNEWEGWIRSHGERDGVSTRIRKIQACEALGGEVLAVSADVTDKKRMRAVVAEARKRFGALHGVIHAAGTLDDGLIQLKTADSARGVLAPKITGAVTLDEVIGDEPLDFFALFSSVSSILGIQGQVDYAAANAFLDSFAESRSARRAGQTVAINWGAWRDAGMAARAYAEEHRPAHDTTQPQPRHPWLESRRKKGDEIIFATEFNRARQWVLGEHVLHDGEALIPGTGYLELARAAFQELEKTPNVEISHVFFQTPFMVRAGETKVLEIALRRDGARWEFRIQSEAGAVTHVTGYLAAGAAPRASMIDIQAVARRCGDEERLNGFLNQSFMDFGPRWGNVQSIRYGAGEALLTLELPPEFANDLDIITLHPALLDVATGGAQRLLAEEGRRDFDFFVPFSYDRLILRNGLTRKLSSHVRRRKAVTQGLASFDVTIADETGTVLVEVSDFTMKRVSDRGLSAMQPTAPAITAGSSAAAMARHVQREGILPQEGAEAFERILSAKIAPRVAASSVNLFAWMKQVDISSIGNPVQTAPVAGSIAATASPMTGLSGGGGPVERKLAAMFSQILGVDSVDARDDFFALGGHSLLAVRLLARIEREFGKNVPIATLFERPTIEGLAFYLRGDQPATEEQPSPVVEGSDRYAEAPSSVSQEKSPTLFLMPGMGKDEPRLVRFRAACLPALRMVGMDYGDWPEWVAAGLDFEVLIHRLVAEIQAAAPEGPLMLAGYSLGGHIVYATAAALAAAGRSIKFLGIIDQAFSRDTIDRVPGAGPKTRGGELARFWTAIRRGEAADEFAVMVSRRLIGPRWAPFLRVAARFHRAPLPGDLGFYLPWRLSMYLLVEMVRRWHAKIGEPKALLAPTVLFRGNDFATWTAPDLGWRKLCPNVTVVRVDGHHTTMFDPPYLDSFVRAFIAAVDNVTHPVEENQNAVVEPAFGAE